jgi:ribose transport system substrate-binding protein
MRPKRRSKLGWKVESLAPDRETNFAAQVDMVQALVRRKVNAISICAINDTAIVGAIEQANAAGIPVFVHNSLMDIAGGKIEAYVGYNQRKAGKLCGEYAAELLKGRHGDYKGKVYLLLGIPGVHTTERSAGFLEGIQPHPGIEVVAQTPANWERQQAMNLALAALKATPDIDVFFGCSDAMAQGASQAGREAGKDMFTIGIDGNPDTLEDIKNGVVTATCAVYPGEMGRITVRTIKQLLDGKPVERKVETPIKMIDKSNVDELLGK